MRTFQPKRCSVLLRRPLLPSLLAPAKYLKYCLAVHIQLLTTSFLTVALSGGPSDWLPEKKKKKFCECCKFVHRESRLCQVVSRLTCCGWVNFTVLTHLWTKVLGRLTNARSSSSTLTSCSVLASRWNKKLFLKAKKKKTKCCFGECDGPVPLFFLHSFSKPNESLLVAGAYPVKAYTWLCPTEGQFSPLITSEAGLRL